MQRIFIKKCFLFTVGCVHHVKQFITVLRKSRKRLADDGEVETEVRKWLRQQSERFYAAGFDALVKQWDDVGRGDVEK
jgi:hypothetical protein